MTFITFPCITFMLASRVTFLDNFIIGRTVMKESNEEMYECEDINFNPRDTFLVVFLSDSPRRRAVTVEGRWGKLF